MTLTTSKGKTYTADSAGGPTVISGMVFVQMKDERRLSEIAEEFEGLEWMEAYRKSSPDQRWEGFTLLQSISRMTGDIVRIALAKP